MTMKKNEQGVKRTSGKDQGKGIAQEKTCKCFI